MTKLKQNRNIWLNSLGVVLSLITFKQGDMAYMKNQGLGVVLSLITFKQTKGCIVGCFSLGVVLSKYKKRRKLL